MVSRLYPWARPEVKLHACMNVMRYHAADSLESALSYTADVQLFASRYCTPQTSRAILLRDLC